MLDELGAWCVTGARVAVRVVYGPGGVGKTRALLELVRRQRAAGALAGFLRKGVTAADLMALAGDDRRVVAVLDYADGCAQLHGLLQALAGLRDSVQVFRVRVCLLARSAGDWLSVAKGLSSSVSALLGECEPVRLERLDVAPREAYAAAHAAFADTLGKTLPSDPPPPPPLEEPVYQRVLYVHMAALATVLGVQFTPASLVDEVLAHETRAWDARLERQLGREAALPLPAAAARHRAMRLVMAMTTLRGGVRTEGEATALLDRMRLGLPGAVLGGVLEVLHRLYGRGGDAVERDARGAADARGLKERGQHLAALEPEVLGEALVYGVLTSLEPEGAGALLVAAFADNDASALTSAFVVFGRMSSDRAGVEPWMTAMLDADIVNRGLVAFRAVLSLAGSENADDRLRVVHTRLGQVLARSLQRGGTVETAVSISQLLPRNSVSLLEVAAWAGSKIVEMHAAGVGGTSRRELATALVEQSVVEASLGHWSASLCLAERALEVGRTVVKVSPGDAESVNVLESCLMTLSFVLGHVGRADAATSTAIEAVVLLRQLFVLDPPRFRFGLAASLHNLGCCQNAGGQFEAALESIIEAVALFRELASGEPDTFLPDLAASLDSLGVHQSSLGQLEAAFASTSEAVAVYRELAHRRPDAFLPDMAKSLNNLGNRLERLGQREAALKSTMEAVTVYRALVTTRRDAFLPKLARSLRNLGAMRDALGHREEALALMQEAVTMYRDLVLVRPDVSLRDLAESLISTATLLRVLGQPQMALTSAAEAVTICRDLVYARPDAFKTILAASLNCLGVTQNMVGQRVEALTSMKEAVVINRELARACPKASLPDLATSLHGLGVVQNSLGLRETALTSTLDAVAIRRELVHGHRDAFLPSLASSLNSLGVIQNSLGQHGAALKSTTEALGMLRTLVQSNPNVFASGLAVILNSLGGTQSALGQREAALASSKEAIAIFRKLVHARPDAYLPDLAACLNTVADIYFGLGRFDDAVIAAEESVSIYRGLAATLPDRFAEEVEDPLRTLNKAMLETGRH